MAEEHNALKYSPLISQGAAVVLGVGISRLSESLVVAADLWSKPEWAFPRGELLWSVNPSQAAVVAEFSQVGIRNPVGSGLIIVIDEIEIVGPAVVGAMEERLAASTVVDATGSPSCRDTRRPPTSGANVQTVSFANAAAARLGFLLATHALNANLWNRYPVEVVLTPGFDFYVGPSLVNTAISCNFWGRERFAFPGELPTRG